MCGILGIVAPVGARPSVSPAEVAKMRDRMADRGPDGQGLVAQDHVVFAHRRLAVIDPAGGAQPMRSPDRRFLLVYNGELYNDAELRRQLASRGVAFRTNCDTETVLHAFATWGVEAFSKMRGMFALAVYDFKLQLLTLARDPLGIKPLYFAQLGDDFILASTIPSILAHPAANPRPNLPVVSAYLTTIRTTLGNETMFEGVYTLRPGQLAQVDFNGNRNQPRVSGLDYWREPEDIDDGLPFEAATAAVREAVVDSIASHLRSDVPRCLLLSGGLDSAIIATICRDLGGRDLMRTWCAGDIDDTGGDLAHARMMADRLGADHHEVRLDAARFVELWAQLIEVNGLPLSTPNETAILAVALDLKPHATVALSGEGADELFAGYAAPILSGMDGRRAAMDESAWPGGEAARQRYREELAAQYGRADLGDAVEHYLHCNSWIPVEAKADLWATKFAGAIDGDRALRGELEWQFARDPEGIDPTEALLRVHRRINLTGLLGRLDTSTMAAGVEGRTPLADVRIAELAMRLPVSQKIRVELEDDGGWSSAVATLTRQRVETKRVLRAAFADALPGAIVSRPKSSFPLPFQQWMTPMARVLRESAVMREVFSTQVLNAIAADPATHWQAAWPLINLGIWCRRWWG